MAGILALVLAGCSTLLVDNYRYGRIDVQALMESGEPAVGIPMVLYQDTVILAHGSTSATGEFSFNFVPFGSVGVMLRLAPDYETSDSHTFAYRDDIDVSDGGRVSVQFTGIRSVDNTPEE